MSTTTGEIVDGDLQIVISRIQNPMESITEDDLTSLTHQETAWICRFFHLPYTGKKAAMISRLLELNAANRSEQLVLEEERAEERASKRRRIEEDRVDQIARQAREHDALYRALLVQILKDQYEGGDDGIRIRNTVEKNGLDGEYFLMRL